MKNLGGWQVVALVGILAAAFCVLVGLGQDVGALVAAGLLIAGALGVPIVQGAVNAEKLNNNNALANGNLAALREQMERVISQHAEQMAEKDRQLQAANDKAVTLAALIPTDAKLPESFHG